METMEAKIKPTKEQEEIIKKAPGENILVSAAAGSGKTRVLVERITHLITNEKYNIRLSDILVMTFTIAATGEMKDRIKKALDEKLQEEGISKKLKEKLISELAVLQNANISTIDSFCKKILMENYHALGSENCIYGEFDPAYRIADEKELMILYENVLDKFLEEKYSDMKYKPLYDLYFNKTDDSKLRMILLDGIKHFMTLAWPREEILKQIDNFDSISKKAYSEYQKLELNEAFFFKDDINTYVDKLDKLINIYKLSSSKSMDGLILVKDLLVKYSKVEINASNARRLIDEVLNLPKITLDYKKIVDAGKVDKKILESLIGYCKEEIISKFKELPDINRLENINKDLIYNKNEKLVLELILEYFDKIVEEKRNKNIYAITDYAGFALDILYDKKEGKRVISDMAYEIGDKYKLIFVDEYQDTNNIQEKLILALSTNKDGSSKNNLFLVGDMKQSIYGFRNTEPHLFKEKEQDKNYFQGRLKDNFRSQNKIIRFVNTVFDKIMVEDFGEIDYTKQELGINEKNNTEEHEGKPVEVNVVIEKDKEDIDKENKHSGNEYEAEFIADRVKKLIDEEKYKASDIMILARNYNKFPIIMDALGRQGIQSFSVQKKGFFGRMEINLAIDMLSIIDNPLQDIPLTNVLTSDLYGITPDELAFMQLTNRDEIYANKRERKGFLMDAVTFVLNNDISEAYKEYDINKERLIDKLTKFNDTFTELRFKSRFISISELITLMYEKTYIKDIVESMPEGDFRIANLNILYDNAKKYEETSYVGLFNFLRYIEKIKDTKSDQGLANIASDDENVVKMTTIHQSKGLQYKVVILCGMHTNYNLKDTSLNADFLYDNEYGISLNYYDAKENLYYFTPKRRVVSKIIENKSKQEEMRVLYVALTRAKERLILTGFASNSSYFQKKELNETEITIGKIKDAKNYYSLIVPCIDHNSTNDYVYSEIDSGIYDSRFTEQVENKKKIRRFILKDTALKNIGVEYKYSDLQNIKPKVSVTELKESVKDKNYEKVLSEAYYENKDLNEQEVKKLAANLRGNAYHRYMEFFNFSNKVYDKHSESEYENYSCIEKDKIDKLLNSDIGKQMCKAYEDNRLFREHKFMKLISTNDINKYKNIDSIKGEVFDDKNIVIQGIVDAFIVNPDDTITIIDYKTDMMDSKKNASDIRKQLIENYEIQLKVYSDVLAETTGMKVKDRIIWSFAIDEGILLAKV